MDPSQKALLFQALHVGGGALLLPNAWDAVSARMLEQAGFPAIATASAAIALAHGVADGEQVSRDAMVRAIARIAGAVSVPVSADMESGYGESPDEVAETTRRVIGAGAVGVNIEDQVDHVRLRPIAEMAARIAAARRAAEAEGIELYINGRIDACLIGMDGDAAYEEILARAEAYLGAGASGIFVITADMELIGRVAARIEAPLNVLAMDAAMPPLSQLAALGVRRVSTGPRLMQLMMGHLLADATRMLEDGRFDVLAGALSYADLEIGAE